MTERVNFGPLHEWMRENDAAGTMMVPADAEDVYLFMRDAQPELPEWEDIREDVLNSWEWRKGIAEMMSERAFEMFYGMFEDVLSERGAL